jgi:A/G-specific adenine glycosylase
VNPASGLPAAGSRPQAPSSGLRQPAARSLAGAQVPLERRSPHERQAEVALADALLAWGMPRMRDLPWRRTRDPWAILVSEMMLQQTQVARVLPKFVDFLAAWPTPEACASAPAADIVRAWAGLGYNRRALNLHRAAVAVAAHDRGGFPRDLADLLALPGVGPYTARAISAFAYEADVGVVDTNIARVLARLAGRSLSAREVQALADALVPPGEGWAWNQVLMDFGAEWCTARSTPCAICPVRGECRFAGVGPDPAVGSAGVSGGQSRFVGSDRQGRGRLVDALRSAPVSADRLATVMGWPDNPDRASRVAATLLADGLVRRDNDQFCLA